MRRRFGLVGLALVLALAGSATAQPDCQEYGGGMRWLTGIHLGFTGDADIAFSEFYAYFAHEDIVIFDVSDPDHLQEIDIVDSWGPRRIATQGDLLFAAVWTYGVEIFSIADREHPELLTRFDVGERVMEVFPIGDLLYVGTIDLGLQVLDITNPAQPVILSSTLDGDCYRIAHQGNFLYTVYEDGTPNSSLRVFHLDDPAFPSHTSTWGNRVEHAHPDGDLLYLALGFDGFAQFSLDSPGQPALLGVQESFGVVREVRSEDGYLFVLHSNVSNITCYDRAGEMPWEQVGVVNTEFGPDGLEQHGGRTFVPSSNWLEVFDLSAPVATASQLGYYENVAAPFLRDVAIVDKWALVTNDGYSIGEKMIEIIDVSDPAAPQFVHRLSYWNGAPVDIELRGDYAYVASFRGIDVVDVSYPPQAARVGELITPGSALQVAAAGEHLYIADGEADLQVASLALDPVQPTIIASLSFPNEAVGVTVVGGTALVLASDGTLFSIDVTSPSAPALLDQIYAFQGGEHISVQGHHAYLDGDDGIHVVDIADPSALELVASLALPSTSRDVYPAGGALYVAAYSAGLQVVDITTPTQPRLIGGLAMEYLAHGLTVVDGVVYVASDSRLNLAALDCLSVTAIGDAAPPANPLALAAHPNPFNPTIRLRFRLADPAAVELAIYDASGRCVRTLLTGARFDAGEQALNWNGTDEAGGDLPSGVYLVELRVGEQVASEKLTLLR